MKHKIYRKKRKRGIKKKKEIATSYIKYKMWKKERNKMTLEE
jgi:hypothetical protein